MMRAAAIGLTLALGVSLLGVGVLATGVYGTRDQVTFTPETLYGDPTALDGVTVQATAQYSDRLFWTSTLPLDAPETAETAYTRYSNRQYLTRDTQYEGVSMDNQDLIAWDREEGASQEGLAAAMQALAENTPPGETGETTVRLADYLDTYPITIRLDLPGHSRHCSPWDTDQTEEYQMVRAVVDRFSIPVLPDEYISLHVDVRPDGQVGSWGYGSGSISVTPDGGPPAESDSYNLYTYSAVAGDSIWFTLDTRTQKGKVIDTSGLPGGYGIYRLPYQKDGSGATTVDAGQLDMVYPLDPNIQIMDFRADQARNQLLLTAAEDGVLTMRVIDLTTLETRQTLTLSPWVEDEQYLDILYWSPDMRLFQLGSTDGANDLAVISVDDGGTLTEEFRCPAIPEGQDELWDRSQPWTVVNHHGSASFDGQRLVLAGLPDQRRAVLGGESWEHDYPSGSIQAMVYDKTGLRWAGVFHSSLDTGVDLGYGFYVSGWDDVTIRQ